jgi:hypothetical protein
MELRFKAFGDLFNKSLDIAELRIAMSQMTRKAFVGAITHVNTSVDLEVNQAFWAMCEVLATLEPGDITTATSLLGENEYRCSADTCFFGWVAVFPLFSQP